MTSGIASSYLDPCTATEGIFLSPSHFRGPRSFFEVDPKRPTQNSFAWRRDARERTGPSQKIRSTENGSLYWSPLSPSRCTKIPLSKNSKDYALPLHSPAFPPFRDNDFPLEHICLEGVNRQLAHNALHEREPGSRFFL